MVRSRARSRSRSRSRIERPRTRTRTSTDGGRPLRVVPFYLALLHEARRERRARRDRRRGGLHLHEREGLIGPLLGVPGDGGALLVEREGEEARRPDQREDEGAGDSGQAARTLL